MKVNNILSFQSQFKSSQSIQNSSEEKQSKNNDSKNTFLDKFETSIRNSADLNDTIQVPRTIFKGYLSFCAGSALMPVASMIKNNFPKTSNALNIINAGLIIYGTYSFVRPYLITQKKD